MMNFLKKIDLTVRQMWLGVFLWGVFLQLAFVWFSGQRLKYSLGVWIGVLCAWAMIYHMWWALDKALDDEASASKYVIKHNMIRYGVLILVFVLCTVTKICDPLIMFASVMGVKVSAYLQPFIHKITRGCSNP